MATKNSVGRPRLYSNAVRARVLRAIIRAGSMKGAQRALAGRDLEISMAVIQDVAREAKLKFKRGRNAVSLRSRRKAA